jgi:hypothetical protein
MTNVNTLNTHAATLIIASGKLKATHRDIIKEDNAAFIASAKGTHADLLNGATAEGISLLVKDAVTAKQVLAKDVLTSDVAVAYHAVTGQALLLPVLPGKPLTITARELQEVIRKLGVSKARPIVEAGTDLADVEIKLEKALKIKIKAAEDKKKKAESDTEDKTVKTVKTAAELIKAISNIIGGLEKIEGWSAADVASARTEASRLVTIYRSKTVAVAS